MRRKIEKLNFQSRDLCLRALGMRKKRAQKWEEEK